MDYNKKSTWAFLGSWGYFWRAVVYLAGFALIALVLSLLLHGNMLSGLTGNNGGDNRNENRFENPSDDQKTPFWPWDRKKDKDQNDPGRKKPADPDNPEDPGYQKPFDPDDPTTNPNNPNNPDSPYNPQNPGNDPDDPDNPYGDYPPELVDPQPVDGWNDPITGVPELPDEDHNYMPPMDTTRYVPNPEDPNSQIVGDQLIVYFNSKDIKADMASFARQFKACYPGNEYRIAYYNTSTASMLLTVPASQLNTVMNELPSKIKGVDFIVVTNGIIDEAAKPSDPGFSEASYDEYFRLIQAYEAWDITKGSPDVKVAIVDSYFDLGHPEIGERYVDPIHIPSKTTRVLPPAKMPNIKNFEVYCHGSHVAGIAVGAQNNRLGVSGIAPECSWIPIALGEHMTYFHLMEGILYAVYHGADVINLSLGRGFDENAYLTPIDEQISISQNADKRGEQLWEYVYKVAEDHGCVICTAGGNEKLLMGMDPMNRSKHIIKVEAVDGKGQMADEFTNFGQDSSGQVNYSTVSAPGVDLWSVSDRRTAPFWRLYGVKVSTKDELQEMSGTSMASPVVTGAVALLKSKNKDLTPEEIIKILMMTGKQTDKSGKIGPTIQIRDALDAAAGGQKLNFDDLMQDHNLLLGKWKSTRIMYLSNPVTDELIDEMWTYLTFTSTSSGTLQFRTVNTKRVYEAPLSVTWGNQQIIIRQLSDAVDSDGHYVQKDDFYCTPNASRLLEASVRRNGQERFVFELEKVN